MNMELPTLSCTSSSTISLVIATLLLLASTSTVTLGNELGEYIADFSPLLYDSVDLHNRHAVTKRSIYDKVVDLPLVYKGRKLDLSLYPADDGTIHSDAVILTNGKASIFDSSHLYSGYVKGDSQSSVTGSIIQGVFQGMISTGSNDVYYVDRKEYHPTHPLTEHEQVHSVIYKKDDVDIGKFNELRRAKRSSGNHGFCGQPYHIVDDLLKNMEGHVYPFSQSERKKRATPDNNVCNLYLQSDPEIWTYFKSTLPGADDTMVKQEISAFFRELVREVNGIYRNTNFNGLSGYELRIDRLAINKTCGSGDDHWFCDKDVDVGNYLNLNTYTNHDAYCLAYILTYRDFADGTLGLAWVAKAGSLAGGICSKYATFSEAGSPRKKSLNTGIVTMKNYGERVPKLMSQLTLAHEIGHNFGSEHDPTGSSQDCTPYTSNDNEDGNFIMYFAAISGKRTNNIKFSPCSIANISQVLSNNRNTACFLEPTDGHCGNQIKDGQEVCDCGYTADCHDSKDRTTCCPCCVGQDPTNNANGACTLRSGKTCDPSQGPCCSLECNFRGATKQCSPATECSMASNCGATGVECPIPSPKNDGTLCNDKTQVCNSGQCNQTICSKISGLTPWTECSVASTDTGATAASLCAISCEDPSTKTCHSSANTGSLPQSFQTMLTSENAGEAISVKPGYPCDKEQGFCDYFLTCRKINELGPLARLKGLLLSLTSIEALTEWMKKYWWVVLISVLGLVGFTALLVKFGVVFTPSSNPDKPLNRRLTKPMTPRGRNVDPAGEPLQVAGPSVGERRKDEMEMR